MSVAVRYKGKNGEHFHGIPAADMSEEEFDALTPEQKATVKASPLYAVADSVPHARTHAAPAAETEKK